VVLFVVFCALAALHAYRSLNAAKRQKTLVNDLFKAADQYRSVVDNVSVGIVVIDPSMKIVSLNRQMREWFPHIDLGQKPFCYSSFHGPEQKSICADCQALKTFQDGEVHEITKPTPTPKGVRDFRILSTPIKDKAGRVIAAVEMAEDVTDRRRNEEELQDALRRQSALSDMRRMSLAPLPLNQKLTKILEILLTTPWFNVERKGCIMLLDDAGLSMTAQVGLPAALQTACARLPLGKCLCGRVAQTGQEITTSALDDRHEVSLPGMTEHGHVCLPLKVDGEILGVLNLYLHAGATLDLRQQDFARAAADIVASVVLLSRFEERFLQAQKMEAVGRLAGGIAHDFNNILTAIQGYAALLNSGFKPDDPRSEDAREILKASERASNLTRQLLAFSRRQVLAPKILAANAVIEGMSGMLRRLVGADVRLQLSLAPNLPAILADQGQMEQILMNLAVNARDAMPKGGTLTISTHDETGTPPQANVRIGVSDTGEGMPPEVVRRIFEPFFTTKPKDKGTGLGLSTVYGIVKQSGGNVQVTSEPGVGTLFEITLPACVEQAASVTKL